MEKKNKKKTFKQNHPMKTKTIKFIELKNRKP